MDGSYPTISSEAKDGSTFVSDGTSGEGAGMNQAQESKKPRGRPKKATDGDAGAKKGRGRPKKATSDETNGQKSAAIEVAAESLRKAGEPLGSEFPESALQCDLNDGTKTAVGDDTAKAKRPRGRPRKNPGQAATPKTPKYDGPKRGRGRPRKDGSGPLTKKRQAEASEQETSPKKLKSTDNEAGESEGKACPGHSSKAPVAQDPESEDHTVGTDNPIKAGRRRKVTQNGSNSKKSGVKKRGRPSKKTESKGNEQVSGSISKRPCGRPKSTVESMADVGSSKGEGLLNPQVSFSDSESEESETLGKGIHQSNILSAISASQQQQAAIEATSGNMQLHPSTREPALISKFDESFDEDSDN